MTFMISIFIDFYLNSRLQASMMSFNSKQSVRYSTQLLKTSPLLQRFVLKAKSRFVKFQCSNCFIFMTFHQFHPMPKMNYCGV